MYNYTASITFIALHRWRNPHTIYWVNTSRIVYISTAVVSDGSRTFIHFGCDEDGLEVTETPEEIFALIRGGK